MCNGLVLYEDAPTRDLALRLCGGLSARFQSDLEFQFHWCGFKFLLAPEFGRQAGRAAVNSDLILVSLHRAEGLTFEIVSWLELWLPQRAHGEGVLVVLQNSGDVRDTVPWQDTYLRSLARRAALDYLPVSGLQSIQGVGDRLAEDQSRQIPSEAVHPPPHHYHSSGWGINE